MGTRRGSARHRSHCQNRQAVQCFAGLYSQRGGRQGIYDRQKPAVQSSHNLVACRSDGVGHCHADFRHLPDDRQSVALDRIYLGDTRIGNRGDCFQRNMGQTLGDLSFVQYFGVVDYIELLSAILFLQPMADVHCRRARAGGHYTVVAAQTLPRAEEEKTGKYGK